ncbi:erythromycin esterase family protein [Spirosoma soli]|uniref:Erythromycin esterase family protein n=1 Tax=Spirosoma soli TaxID=1770529 RepID=A0ABW5M5T1_9BACT
MLHLRFALITLLLLNVTPIWAQRLSSAEQELLRQAVVPFNDPDSAVLTPTLTELVRNRSVIAVGEVTHGTKEVERLQIRVAKALVQKHGFKAVSLGEIYMSSTWLLNDYLLFGKDSSRQTLAAVVGMTTDMLDFTKWLRTVNASRPVEQRVWLLGAEMGPPGQLARIALSYVQARRIALPDSVHNLLAELLTLPDTYKAQPNINSLVKRGKSLAVWLARSDTAATLTPKQAWQRQCIQQLTEALETFSRPTQAYRDRAIYENIRWLKERRSNTKVAVIRIHNAHIEKRPCYEWEGLTRAGYWLDSAYRQQYLAIGTEVGKGAYASGNEKELLTIRVPESRRKVGTLIGAVTSTPYGFINLNASPEVRQFFQVHNHLTYGTSDQRTGMIWPCKTLPDAFDALVYSRKSTPMQSVGGIYAGPVVPLFCIYLNMTDSLKHQLQKARQFRISLRADFSEIADAESSVRLSVYCHDRRKKQLFNCLLLLNSGTAAEQLVKVPARTKFISVGLYAEQISTLTLKQFMVNDSPLPTSVFSLHKWKPNDTGAKGDYQISYTTGQILVQRK